MKALYLRFGVGGTRAKGVGIRVEEGFRVIDDLETFEFNRCAMIRARELATCFLGIFLPSNSFFSHELRKISLQVDV